MRLINKTSLSFIVTFLVIIVVSFFVAVTLGALGDRGYASSVGARGVEAAAELGAFPQ